MACGDRVARAYRRVKEGIAVECGVWLLLSSWEATFVLGSVRVGCCRIVGYCLWNVGYESVRACGGVDEVVAIE